MSQSFPTVLPGIYSILLNGRNKMASAGLGKNSRINLKSYREKVQMQIANSTAKQTK